MTHTLVVGAGIVGIATAIWLQRVGHTVSLIDREGPASGTSYGNAGVLAAGAVVPVPMPGLWRKAPTMLLNKNAPLFLKWGYLPKLLPFLAKYLNHCSDGHVRRYAKGMLPLVYDTVEQHRALAKDTAAEKYIEDRDYCFGYETAAEFEADGYGWSIRKDFGLDFTVMPGTEYSKSDPVYEAAFHTVVSCKHHGMISDPGGYVTELAKHFVSEGGEIIVARVQDIGESPSGAPILITEEGELGGDHVVIAAGAWSKLLLTRLGLSVPLESERGYHIELIAPNKLPHNPMMVASGKFVATPMVGRIRCAGLVEFGGLNAGPSRAPLEMLKRRVARLFSALTYENQTEWLGHRPALPDSLPIVGKVSNSGVYAAFGHQHLGLTGGAKTGRILADMITQSDQSSERDGPFANLEMTPYAPGRF